MSREIHARIIRSSYMPVNKPGVTEILIQIPGEMDLSYRDSVVVVIPEGEVK